MLDFFDLPTNQKTDQKIYTTSSGGFQTWQKPRGINLIDIFILGAGGGGGAGAVSAGGAFGGGGGASGNQYHCLFPAYCLPDELYVYVGQGGSGGIYSGSVAATSGTASYVSIWPAATANFIVGIASFGFFGAAGVTNSSGVGGSASAADTIGAAALAGLGISLCAVTAGNISIAGQAGGSAGATPTFLLPTTGLRVTGGTAGGIGATSTVAPKDPAALPTTTTGIFPTLPAGASGVNSAGQVNGGNGSNGIAIRNLNYFYGGTGGGGGGYQSGGPYGFGGKGGDGAYGCGGGGGGGIYSATLTNGVTAQPGNGGKGGDGLVIITCW
jgi:hypothetical protein